MKTRLQKALIKFKKIEKKIRKDKSYKAEINVPIHYKKDFAFMAELAKRTGYKLDTYHKHNTMKELNHWENSEWYNEANERVYMGLKFYPRTKEFMVINWKPSAEEQDHNIVNAGQEV